MPGLDRAVDFGSFTHHGHARRLAVLGARRSARPVGNWGWAIVGLVVLIKLAAVSAVGRAVQVDGEDAQVPAAHRSSCKERYGDDKQKLQMAMMELYKKEKINPVGGCLPILVQMPVFLALYWVLSESVELRHAPWIAGSTT